MHLFEIEIEKFNCMRVHHLFSKSLFTLILVYLNFCILDETGADRGRQRDRDKEESGK